VILYSGKVTHAPQQTIGKWRGVPRLRPAIVGAASSLKVTAERSVAERSTNDGQLLRVVEVQLANESETVAQRCGNQTRSRGPPTR